MAIYDFFVSRNNAVANTAAYVGHVGRLFYDDTNGVVKLSDGVTPGGTAIPYTIATDSIVGGIKAGAGANVSADGTLTIDTTGLPLSIGNLSIEDTTISTAVADEELIIATNGAGNIEIVGSFRVHKTDGNIAQAIEEEPIFRVLSDGQVRILVPLADTQEGGMEIIGSELGTSLQPGIAGTMLHLTGNADLPTRVYHDTLGGYSSYVFRRYNGSVTSPTQVLADEAVARINFTAATDAGMGNVALAQIRISAIEDQTTTAQGSEIQFFVTPEGSPATSRISALDIRAAGVTSDVGFVGNLLTNAQPNITSVGTLTELTVSGNLNVQGNILGNAETTTATIGTAEITTANVGNVNVDKINIASGGLRTIEGGIYANLNFATDSIVHLYHPTGAITVNLSNYKAGATVRLIIRMDTRRTINLGVASTQNSTKGATTIVDNTLLNNSCVILNYTCMDGTAGNTFVGVNTVD